MQNLLLAESPDAIISTDVEGRVLFWSKGAEAIYGFTAQEAVDKRLTDVVVLEDRMEDEQRLRAAVMKEGVVTYETLRKNKNGSLVFVLVTSKAICSDDGTVEYILSSEKDVTSLTQERDAKRVESRFGEFLESAPDGIVIVNPAGRIVLANSHAKNMFGYAADDLKGRSIEILLPERFRNNHIGRRSEFFLSPRTRAMGAGLELFGLRKDGSEFPLEISLSPLRMEEGLLVMSAIRDITERKKAEEKFRGLLESAPDAIIIVNRSGNIVLVNSQTEKLFQFDRTELLGQPIEILVPSRFHDRHQMHREQYYDGPMKRPMGADLELYGVRKDGTEFPVEISLSPLETEEGVLVSSAIRDISQRKAADAVLRDRTLELEAANKELEAFSYSVSHDLRAPLRAINGFSSILLKEHMNVLPPDVQRYLLLINQNTEHMGTLVDDLLKFSRLSRQSVQKQWIDTNTIVRSVIDQIQASHTGESLSFEIRPLPQSYADHTLLKQVWTNLLSNAAKFIRKGVSPVIRIGCTQENGTTVFSVSDNGIGFDMEYAGKLFGVFQRLHRAEEFDGTGVGLALVQRIVHRHGGKVWAESMPNRGSTFYFTLGVQ